MKCGDVVYELGRLTLHFSALDESINFFGAWMLGCRDAEIAERTIGQMPFRHKAPHPASSPYLPPDARTLSHTSGYIDKYGCRGENLEDGFAGPVR